MQTNAEIGLGGTARAEKGFGELDQLKGSGKNIGLTGSRAMGKKECVSPRVNESAVGST